MPLKIDARDRKLLIGALWVLVLIIGVTVLFGTRRRTRTRNPEQLLDRVIRRQGCISHAVAVGLQRAALGKVVIELPQKAGTTLIIAEPMEAPLAASASG